MAYSPPPAKTEISDTYPNPSNAVARAGFGTLWDYVTGLLGMTGNPAAAQTALQLVPGTNVQAYSSTLQSYANGNTLGFKNRIINGAMVIDQRNAGASVTPTNLQYMLDRWFASVSQASKFTVQQNAGSVTSPVGFSNYLGVTSSSAYSVGAADNFNIGQKIEGYNFADMAWGTANASAVTLSFWVRSSLTGSFGASVFNNATNRSYPFSYTINSANTWEYKTVTIPGDTTGTWVGATNGIGLYIYWSLGCGSNYNGTANTWAGALYLQPSGATSVVGTNGATFYITGVQLEKGSTATSFDYRPYGTELALCQRYYYQFTSGVAFGSYWSSADVFLTAKLPVTMRTNPSTTLPSGTMTNYIDIVGAGTTNPGSFGAYGYQSTENYNFYALAAAGAATGRPGSYVGSFPIRLSAEL
jgi:hypothetical protein